jgi:hypothetical protein
MRAFSKEIIEKLKSMPDDKKEKVLDGLARLYAVRPYRASEGIKDSVHPETPDETLMVSNSETRDFSSWQGNQGVERRRSPDSVANFRESES